MQRVAVLGSVGAGKSVLATRIAERTGLPVVHLDVLFWRSGWTPAPRERASRELADAVARDEWILDGNFLGEEGGDARFERADTVVLLDFPRRTCLWRVLKRAARERGRARADLPEGCTEGVSASVLRWIWSYPLVERPRVMQALARVRENGVAVHHLRSPADVDRFVERLPPRPRRADLRRQCG